MLRPAGYAVSGFVSSDAQRAVSGAAAVEFNRSRAGDGRHFRVRTSLTVRPSHRLNLALEPEYTSGGTSAQFLESEDDPLAIATFGRRYLFGVLRQRMFSANLRASVIFTPRLSFQLFTQPLLSSLRYRRVRQLARPRSFEFEDTGLDPAKYSETVLSLRGSGVLRWEYRRGCTFFLVWNGNQAREDPSPRFHVGRGFAQLTDLRPDHVFLAKLTYWWSPS